MIKILTKNGIENTNKEGAIDFLFNSGYQDGYIPNIANELNVVAIGNQIVINTGELRIRGHRIILTDQEQFTFSNIPTSDTDYKIVGTLTVSDLDVTFIFKNVLANYENVQDDFYSTLNGDGVYEVDICGFTKKTTGDITNVTKLIKPIITNSKDGLNDLLATQLEIESVKFNKDASLSVGYGYNSETEADLIITSKPISKKMIDLINQDKIVLLPYYPIKYRYGFVTSFNETVMDTITDGTFNYATKIEVLKKLIIKITPSDVVNYNGVYLVKKVINFMDFIPDRMKAFYEINGGAIPITKADKGLAEVWLRNKYETLPSTTSHFLLKQWEPYGKKFNNYPYKTIYDFSEFKIAVTYDNSFKISPTSLRVTNDNNLQNVAIPIEKIRTFGYELQTNSEVIEIRYPYNSTNFNPFLLSSRKLIYWWKEKVRFDPISKSPLALSGADFEISRADNDQNIERIKFGFAILNDDYLNANKLTKYRFAKSKEHLHVKYYLLNNKVLTQLVKIKE